MLEGLDMKTAKRVIAMVATEAKLDRLTEMVKPKLPDDMVLSE